MDGKTIEGPWDQLIQRSDLRGHWVRITVLDEAPQQQAIDPDEQFKRIQEFEKSLPHITHFVDDSRESIYSGTLDDPR